MPGLVWRRSSGAVGPLAEASVPLAAPGVLFGETVFETLRVRRGRIFQLGRHAERLHGAIGRLGWGALPSPAEFQRALAAILDIAAHARPPGWADDLRVRVTVVRLDDEGASECFVQAAPYTPPSPAQYEAGVDAIVSTVRLDGAAPWTRFKLGNRFVFRRAQTEARRAGVYEALLLNTDGLLADGSVANVHFVEGGRVLAPGLGGGALPGIAQSVVKECAAQARIPWQWGDFPPCRLIRAQEAFLTNALIGVLPLVRVQGEAVGDGRPGLVTRALQRAYDARVEAESCPVVEGDCG